MHRSPITGKDLSQPYETIRLLLLARAKALHEDRRDAAITHTRALVQAHADLGQNSRAFEPVIFINGEARWFDGFTKDGSAKYSRENNIGQWFYELTITEDALAQRGWTPEDRARLEHRVNVELRCFGHADDLTGYVLHEGQEQTWNDTLRLFNAS